MITINSLEFKYLDEDISKISVGLAYADCIDEEMAQQISEAFRNEFVSLVHQFESQVNELLDSVPQGVA